MQSYYCWRNVEVRSGYLSQYLSGSGQPTADISARAVFGSEAEAQAFADANHQRGEVAFEVGEMTRR